MFSVFLSLFSQPAKFNKNSKETFTRRTHETTTSSPTNTAPPQDEEQTNTETSKT